METSIKETVKAIFLSNTFERALELTSNLRGEYIRQYSVKSWNGLVSYYRKAGIPATETSIVAEPEMDGFTPASEIPQPAAEEEESGTATAAPEEAPAPEGTGSDSEASEAQQEDERIEYMLYRNAGERVEWFGHRENFYGMPVGTTARMIRMNNNGVSEGIVVASNALTLDEIALFHRCYKVIIRMKRSYREQLQLAATCLLNLPEAIGGEYGRVPSSDIKLTDYVLNFKK